MNKARARIERIGNRLVEGFELIALFVIGGTIVWGAVHAYADMMQAGYAGLDDILLLFIYLELGAMIGIQFKTHRLPVIFLLYIAVTAMTRFLVIDIKELPIEKLLLITGAILVLTFCILVLQIGTSRFGSEEPKPPGS